MSKKGWEKESARHALAARGVKTTVPKKVVQYQYPSGNDISRSFYKRYKEVQTIKDPEQKSKALFELLHEITTLQDYIQLSIPSYNYSLIHVKNMTNNANAIMLALARSHGDFDLAARDPYLFEKINQLVSAMQNLVHDYNLQQTEMKELMSTPTITWEKERDILVDTSDAEYWKKEFHKVPKDEE